MLRTESYKIHFWDLHGERLHHIYCTLSDPEEVRKGFNLNLFHYKFLEEAKYQAKGIMNLNRILGHPNQTTYNKYYTAGMIIPLQRLKKISEFLVSKGKKEYSLENLERQGIWLRSAQQSKFYKINFPIDLLDFKKFKLYATIISNIIFNGSLAKPFGFILYCPPEKEAETIKSIEGFFGKGNSYTRRVASEKTGTVRFFFPQLFRHYLTTLYPFEELVGGDKRSIPPIIMNCHKIFNSNQCKEIWKIVVSIAFRGIFFQSLFKKPQSPLEQHRGIISTSNPKILHQLITLLLHLGFKQSNTFNRKLISIKVFEKQPVYLLTISGIENLKKLKNLDLPKQKLKHLNTAISLYKWLIDIRYHSLEVISKLRLDDCYSLNIVRKLPKKDRAVITFAYYLLTKKEIAFDPFDFNPEDMFKIDFTDIEHKYTTTIFTAYGRHLWLLSENGFLRRTLSSDYRRPLFVLSNRGRLVLSGKISKSVLGELISVTTSGQTRLSELAFEFIILQNLDNPIRGSDLISRINREYAPIFAINKLRRTLVKLTKQELIFRKKKGIYQITQSGKEYRRKLGKVKRELLQKI